MNSAVAKLSWREQHHACSITPFASAAAYIAWTCARPAALTSRLEHTQPPESGHDASDAWLASAPRRQQQGKLKGGLLPQR